MISDPYRSGARTGTLNVELKQQRAKRIKRHHCYRGQRQRDRRGTAQTGLQRGGGARSLTGRRIRRLLVRGRVGVSHRRSHPTTSPTRAELQANRYMSLNFSKTTRNTEQMFTLYKMPTLYKVLLQSHNLKESYASSLMILQKKPKNRCLLCTTSFGSNNTLKTHMKAHT